MSVRVKDMQTGQFYGLEEPLVVGRPAPGSEPGLPCASETVSRSHCRLVSGLPGRVTVVDTSSYGTYVNNVKIEGEAVAVPGDVIRLSDDYELLMVGDEGDPATLPPAYARPVRTLVFTDLVDSMGLKRQLGDVEAGARIDRHRQLVRELLAQTGGREIDNAGDGFFLVFEEAPAAIRFALRLQRAHGSAEELPEVRVGIHRGQVRERAGGPDDAKPVLVEGLAVDLTSRIEGLAAPGQILLSAAAVEAARGRVGFEEELITWRSHGPFIFKGMEDVPLDVGEALLASRVGQLPAPVGGAKARRCDERTRVTVGDRYRIEREVGRGSAGVVFAAYDQRLQRPCAIKLLPAGKLDAELRTRLEREAVLSARLGEHPGIVSVFDLGEWPETGEPYLALELVEGETLDQLIQGGIDREVGVGHVASLARALAFAHSKGVVHRDVKPANVLVGGDGRARLSDFGVAKALGEPGELTRTGYSVGTPSYMAPEQVSDSKNVGPPADVYGAGATLYELLTGRPPHRHRNWRATLISVLRGELVPPRERDPSVSEELDALCLRALSADPARRPGADELAERLAQSGA